jgi:transposase
VTWTLICTPVVTSVSETGVVYKRGGDAENLRSRVSTPGSGSRSLGRSVADVAGDLGLSVVTVYRSKAKDQVDRGERAGIATTERSEVAAAKRRIRELQTELELVKKAAALFEEGVRAKTNTR